MTDENKEHNYSLGIESTTTIYNCFMVKNDFEYKMKEKIPFILRYKEAQHQRWNFKVFAMRTIAYPVFPFRYNFLILLRILKDRIVLEYQLFKFVFMNRW